MRAIFYNGWLAAMADGDRVVLAEHIDVLERDHPLRRFVAAVCVWSCETDQGNVSVRWDPGAAEFYARALLMPTELFDPLDRLLPDYELAEHFSVPLEQVQARREDLAAQRAAGG